MNESKIEAEIRKYRELAKADPNVDVTKLALNALDSHSKNFIPVKQKRIAYLVSLAIPGAGFLYSIKYFMTETDDAQETALACGVLACFSILFTWIFAQSLLSGSGVTPDQIQNINPQDIRDVYQ